MLAQDIHAYPTLWLCYVLKVFFIIALVILLVVSVVGLLPWSIRGQTRGRCSPRRCTRCSRAYSIRIDRPASDLRRHRSCRSLSLRSAPCTLRNTTPFCSDTRTSCRPRRSLPRTVRNKMARSLWICLRICSRVGWAWAGSTLL